MKIEIKNCGECPANGISDMTVDQCMIWKDIGQRVFKWRKVNPAIIPSWCPLREREVSHETQI